MAELVIDLTLTVETALSIGAGGSAGVLADKAIVRNRLGQLVLPGSHLKGRLRHACEILARAADLAVCDAPRAETMCPHLGHIPAPCVICQLFGSASYSSPLRFADLIYAEPMLTPAIRPGASINRRRRTVEEQHLFFIETSPPGGLVNFHRAAAIRGALPSVHAAAQTKLLLAGLCFIQNWGGGKSRGLGWGHIDYQAKLDETVVQASELAQAQLELKAQEAAHA